MEKNILQKNFHTRRLVLALLSLSLVFLLFAPFTQVSHAQEPEGAVYVVQEGDSLWEIAVRFRVSVEDLSALNGITNPGQLGVGARLLIPGLEGIRGVLTTRKVGFGDNLRSLSRRYQIPVETLAQLNHFSSPEELFVGTSLVLLEENAALQEPRRVMLTPGQSMLELAVLNGANPWSLVIDNQVENLWSAAAGDVLLWKSTQAPEDQANPGPSALPDSFHSIEINPSPMVQGNTVVLNVNGEQGMEINGTLIDRDLHFLEDSAGGYIALQGVHALTEPGIYTLSMNGTLPPDGTGQKASFAYSQPVLVQSGNYPFDPVLTVSPETIDPAVTAPEDAQWAALASPVTPEKQWDGLFSTPAPPPYNDCWPSRFGNRRSYNGSAYQYFHSGLDFCGGVGVNILAPAAGTVVFAGPLTVRGNATMIDHGWGVYTGYLHQSEFLVKVGDRVEPGQVIGLVGGSGRVTGPHLHWEVWVGGVQVDPLEWLNKIFPTGVTPTP
jgi:murein DD-endopeptidase MepM/ murein hydrolase activator NlpD